MPEENGSLVHRIRDALIGKPRNIKDPSLFHKLALIPLLAWIGLGADGLSSASYGPEEAFKALGRHTYLAVFLALATALTVFIISYAYSRIIEYFPSGGGGYIVATHTLGEKAGVVSGAALLVDYMLTITVSIVSCGDAVFSFFPASWQPYKIPFEVAAILFLVIINLRGVKESVTLPGPDLPDVRRDPRPAHRLRHLLPRRPDRDGRPPDPRRTTGRAWSPWAAGACSSSSSGPFPWAAARSRASRPSPTACRSCASPGSRTARGPWSTWRRRWPSPPAASWSAIFSSASSPTPARPSTPSWPARSSPAGASATSLALVTIFSEGALLLVAAQTGFVDGPRVMANMAVDYWFPHRFASLSEPVHHPERRPPHGRRGHPAARLFQGQHHDPRRHVFDQRVHDLFPFRARHVAVLHQEPEDRAALEEAPARPPHRPDRLPHRPHHHDHRKVPRRRLADPGHHRGRHRPLLPDPGPLQQGQGRGPGARRAAARSRPRASPT